MKIHPPKVIIDDADPFKDALFDRKTFADSLTQLLRNVTESLVIFVNAPWGEGKTTFAQMWRAALKGQKLDVIYFDAYAADYFDDPFVSFSGEILALVDKRLAEAEGIEAPRQEFKKTAVEVGKRLAGLAVKVGLKAITLGAFDAANVAELKEIGSDVASGVSEIGANIIEKKIEDYTTEKDALKAFKESLAKLAAIFRNEQGFPLTIIVDELDRCRPDFALGLLERIKHLFDVQDIAFVLLVNRDQIESYVRAVYGEEVDAGTYLLKFANLFVDLPNQQPLFRSDKGHKDYCRKLFEHYDFSEHVRDGGSLAQSMESLVSHFGLTLREIEKAFVIMALYYSSLPQNELTNEFLIPLLSILKVKRPQLYQGLSKGCIPVDRLFSETRLNQIQNEHDRGVDEWARDMLNFCLMSDTEFEEATKDAKAGTIPVSGPGRFGGWLFRYNLGRRKVIPLFCARLDRFSVQPK
jgi:hypothetical protein